MHLHGYLNILNQINFLFFPFSAHCSVINYDGVNSAPTSPTCRVKWTLITVIYHIFKPFQISTYNRQFQSIHWWGANVIDNIYMEWHVTCSCSSQITASSSPVRHICFTINMCQLIGLKKNGEMKLCTILLQRSNSLIFCFLILKEVAHFKLLLLYAICNFLHKSILVAIDS